jgi:hypothetical protein
MLQAEYFLRNTSDITLMIQMKPNKPRAMLPIHYHIFLTSLYH